MPSTVGPRPPGRGFPPRAPPSPAFPRNIVKAGGTPAHWGAGNRGGRGLYFARFVWPRPPLCKYAAASRGLVGASGIVAVNREGRKACSKWASPSLATSPPDRYMVDKPPLPCALCSAGLLLRPLSCNPSSAAARTCQGGSAAAPGRAWP